MTYLICRLFVAGCGGLFQFLPGHSIIVKSPNYGVGNYPSYSDCRWVFLADSNTRISIAIKTIDLELNYDYIDIYRGFRKQYGKLYSIDSLRRKQYVVAGDMEMHFTSDHGYEKTGFMINVTEGSLLSFSHVKISPVDGWKLLEYSYNGMYHFSRQFIYTLGTRASKTK